MKTISFVVFIGFTSQLLGQQKSTCNWHETTFIQEKNCNALFETSAKVLLVSLIDTVNTYYYEYPIYRKDKNDTIKTRYFKEYIANRKANKQFLKIRKLDFEGVEMKDIYSIEEKELDKKNVDSLKQIMNFYYRPKIDEPELPKCFQPRNAILFLDKKGKIITCIELCLSCAGWRIYSKNKMNYIGAFENLFCWCQKGMSDFFRQNGIHYGIDYFKL